MIVQRSHDTGREVRIADHLARRKRHRHGQRHRRRPPTTARLPLARMTLRREKKAEVRGARLAPFGESNDDFSGVRTVPHAST